ncbi:MAG: 50S ribosomal protein L10 [Flavobacteriales bacterium]|nr:50S ribosomal protein L10 [Flavobacteriales bacterium]
MTKEQKQQEIIEIAELISGSPVFYLTDTSSLNAEATSSLRRECYKAGVQMRVVKNKLLLKALEGIDGKDYSPLYPALKGNTALMLAEVGNVPARLIKDFRVKHKMPTLKAAFIMEDCYVGDDQLPALVAIKSKEELLGDLVALLQSPARNVISALQSGGNTIAGLVKTLEERNS